MVRVTAQKRKIIICLLSDLVIFGVMKIVLGDGEDGGVQWVLFPPFSDFFGVYRPVTTPHM